MAWVEQSVLYTPPQLRQFLKGMRRRASKTAGGMTLTVEPRTLPSR
jgi:hypothetical protein